MRNPNRQDMGIHIAYSGKTLNTYRDNDVNVIDVLRWHLSRHATCSRIDLAFDIRDSAMKISELYEFLKTGMAVTTAKTYQLIIGNDGGCTLYLGSRQSEAFLRIYDKGIESGEGGNWLRVELELKSSKAQFAAYTMSNAPDEKTFQWAQSWLNGFVSFPDTTWRDLLHREAIPLASANKPERDTRKWLVETVAPAMGKYMNRTGDYEVLSAFMAVLRSFDDT